MHACGLKMLRAAPIVVGAALHAAEQHAARAWRPFAAFCIARIFADGVAAIGLAHRPAGRPVASAEQTRPAGRLAHRGMRFFTQ